MAKQRPLQDVLADIVAEGHSYIRLGRHEGGMWYLSTNTGLPYDEERPDQWRAASEDRLSWGEDEVALCEARLAEVRKLHTDRARDVAAVQRDADADAEAALEGFPAPESLTASEVADLGREEGE